MSQLVSWLGGKATLAATVAAELGPHRKYVEVFCGSMAVLLTKAPCGDEVVNDLHGDLVNLARVIAHEKGGPAFYRRVRRLLVCEAMFRELAERIVSRGQERPAPALPDVERAVEFFYASWVGKGGVTGGKGSKLSFAASYGISSGIGRRWRSAVMTVPRWRRRLERVTILNRDGLELLERIADEPEIVVYLDPPYLGKSDGYVHGLDGLSHARLAELACRFRRARVIVSGYREAALLKLYPGWTVRDVPIVQSLAMSAGKQEAVPMAPEVLLINGKSLAGGLFE